jgi:hypothetical protein
MFLGLLLTGALINSCKKEDELATIDTFLSGKGPWELAAVYVYNFKGDTLKTDTLNTKCNLAQTFIFNDDGNCTYTNFNCLTSTATGKWSLSDDRLVLNSDIVCKDTSAAGQSRPFTRMQVVNLGRNSLVIQRNDTLSVVRNLVVRRVTQYGFIHTSR